MTHAVYEQSTGLFTIWDVDDGGVERLLYECKGHSGRDRGRDNPDFDHVKSVGPLPRGFYRIVLCAHPKFRRPAFRLDPFQGNIMHGRSDFWLHGGTVSHGCIILRFVNRDAVEYYKPSTLEVVPGSPAATLGSPQATK